MANKDRGEVTLQAGDVTHIIRFTINSLCNLEDAMGMPITKIGTELDAGAKTKTIKLGTLRTILKHGLIEEKTLDEVGDIIGEAGLPAVMTAIAAGIAQAFPKAEAGTASKDPK